MKTYLTRTSNPNDLFDVFDNFFRPAFSDESSSMKTNIRETDESYELDIEVPGYTKDQIKVSLEKGYLSVVCTRQEKENAGKYRKKEISESCARNYYVGDIPRDCIKAKCDNGILTLTIPKAQPKQIESNYIEIE